TADKIKFDPIANLSKDADNFRGNHKFVSRKPTPLAGKTFIYRLIRLGAAGKRFLIRNTDDVHVEFTSEALKEHQDWLLANLGNIRGTETKRILKFVSGSGIDMFSANRRFPELDADAVGQEWESDGYGWNFYVLGTQPPSVLSPSKRNSLTAAVALIWEGQREKNQISWRLNWAPNSVIVPHERVWKKPELMVEYFVGRLGGIYPTTGTIMKPEDVACDRTLSKDKYNEPTTLPLQRMLNHMRQAAVDVFADEDTVAAELTRRVRKFIVSVVNNHGGFINGPEPAGGGRPPAEERSRICFLSSSSNEAEKPFSGDRSLRRDEEVSSQRGGVPFPDDSSSRLLLYTPKGIGGRIPPEHGILENSG
ncbi:hypothetical protein HDU80_002240, partial [Chytriomyces hyalinus]